MPEKDFGPIESDYAFFMAHASEAAGDVAEYARELAGFAARRSAIRMLDFGCGAGDFTERFLSTIGWPPSLLDLALVEPVAEQRDSAARRLARFSDRVISAATTLPAAKDPSVAPRFDLILSNHVLYYVDDLDVTLAQLLGALAPAATLLVAMAGWDNVLMQLWQFGFALLGQPVPYYAADDVEAALVKRGVRFRKTRSPYQLRFPDSTENRTKILRFLFAEHLASLPPAPLLGQFDRYAQGSHVEIDTHSYHFAVATE